MSVHPERSVRAWSPNSPCPICGGHDRLRRGQGKRCAGFLSSDGHFAHCTREEKAGDLRATKAEPPTYGHRLHGPCGCGVEHAPAPDRRDTVRGRGFPDGTALIEHRIRDIDGHLVGIHRRRKLPDGTKWGPYWYGPDGSKGLGGRRPADLLYQVELLKDAPSDTAVILTEGEPASDALTRLGFLALGTVCGASSTLSPKAASHLRGRRVYCWPDEDEYGPGHMQRNAAMLAAEGAAALYIIRWPGAQHKDDAADFVVRGGDATGVRALMESAARWAGEVDDASIIAALNRVLVGDGYEAREAEGIGVTTNRGWRRILPTLPRVLRVEDWSDYPERLGDEAPLFDQTLTLEMSTLSKTHVETLSISGRDAKRREPDWVHALRRVRAPSRHDWPATADIFDCLGKAHPEHVAVYAASGLVKTDAGELRFTQFGGGALTSRGTADDSHLAQPPGRVRVPVNYGFLEPDPETRVTDLQQLLDLLKVTPGAPSVGAALLGLAGAAPLSPHVPAPAVLVAGPTGSMKTSVATLLLQSQCLDVRGRDQRATVNMREAGSKRWGTEKLLYHLGGVVCLLDDAMQASSKPQKVAAQYEMLSSLGRNAANRSGHTKGRYGRDDHDAGHAESVYPRGALLATVEVLPRPEQHGSDLAAWAVVELQRGRVDLELCSKMQERAAGDARNRAVAGYIQWLLGREDVIREIESEVLATVARYEGIGHPRTADTYARLEVGAASLLRYGIAIDALTEEHAEAQLASIRAALLDAIRRQANLVDDTGGDEAAMSPTRLFYSTMAVAFREGRIVLSDQHRGDHDEPRLPTLPTGYSPARVGWRFNSGTGGWDAGNAMECGILARDANEHWIARVRAADWRQLCRELERVSERDDLLLAGASGLLDQLEEAGLARRGVPSWMWGGQAGGRFRCHQIDLTPLFDAGDDADDDDENRADSTQPSPSHESADVPTPREERQINLEGKAQPTLNVGSRAGETREVSSTSTALPITGQRTPFVALQALLSNNVSQDGLRAIGNVIKDFVGELDDAERRQLRDLYADRLRQARTAGRAEPAPEQPTEAAAVATAEPTIATATTADDETANLEAGDSPPAPERLQSEGASAAVRRTPRAIAVLGADGLYIAKPDGEVTMRREGVPPPPDLDAASLIAMARGLNIEQLWLHPSWMQRAGLPAQLDESTADRHPFVIAALGTWDVRPAGLSRWMHAFLRGGAYDPEPVDLVLPQYDPNKKSAFWAEAPDARCLANALSYFERACGIRYRHSPEASGSALLKELHSGPRALALVAEEMPPPALESTIEWDTYWIRDLEIDERSRPFLHAYDVNAAYLAACSSLTTGRGAVEHLTSPQLDKKRPGYWLANIEFDAPNWLPNPFLPPIPRDQGRYWCTTPTLALAIELGARIEVDEAYLWRDSSRPLEPWYKRLRDARAALLSGDGFPDRAAQQLALKAVKLAYGPLMGGRVASTRWDRSGDPLYRPDWRHAVMATARANQYRTLRKLDVADAPWAVANDCLYLASELADPLDACPAGIRLADNPGSYKVALAGLSLSAVMKRIDETPMRRRSSMALIRALQEVTSTAE